MSTDSISNSVPSPRRVPFDAAIVDLDGTMIDTLGDFVVALNLMLADLGLLLVDWAQVGWSEKAPNT